MNSINDNMVIMQRYLPHELNTRYYAVLLIEMAIELPMFAVNTISQKPLYLAEIKFLMVLKILY